MIRFLRGIPSRAHTNPESWDATEPSEVTFEAEELEDVWTYLEDLHEELDTQIVDVLLD